MHHCHVMRDDQRREPEIRLQIGKKVEDLRLYGHIERRGRLGRRSGTSGRLTIARAMATRWRCPPDKCSRIAVQKPGRQAHDIHHPAPRAAYAHQPRPRAAAMGVR